MSAVILNVGCSILASIIYDISKICLGRSCNKNNKLLIEKIEQKLQENFKDKYEILYMSGVFNSFIQTPFFKDTIENYIIYIITGNYESNMFKGKKNNNVIEEKDIIDYLLNNLYQRYDTKSGTAPSKVLARQFFASFFKFSIDYVVSLLDDEDKISVFLINRRIDFAQENILLRFNETIETIKRTMKCEIIPLENNYDDCINEYHRILKTNHSRAHVYLLDTFDFSGFYVPPTLRQLSSKQEIREHIPDGMRENFIYIEDRLNDCFDDWKYIFDYNSIVYVTGGAGYGKSLFLKKIINDYRDMNILNSSEYLVIYGDLKSFHVENGEAISIVQFLQNSMLKETLMDKKDFPVEMIEYYIKMGRCLVLFDALDEVERQKREELHKRIIAYFKNQNPNNKICITSRNRGFIPEKDVEVFDILPLDKTQIESYVDNIIKLGRFDTKDKTAFLEQSSVLVKKGFLNSFLVLSLLINIYKAERELPENKMELYQKCFDYIAYRREKEKTRAKFDWNLISCMMKDNTFMELAKMCFPNNNDIGKKEIVEMLCKTYRGKYNSEAETERAAEHFLVFCSDRTELFVPAAGEDRYKFFHRSFFEYFYSQYIFLRLREVEEVYNSLQMFDVDSEVFELTLAMMKQKDEPRYQELMEYIFQKAEDEPTNLSTFNILTLGMQVVDDNMYMCKYIDYLTQYNEIIIKNIKHIPNQGIIYNIIDRDNDFVQKIIEAYKSDAELRIINNFFVIFSQVEQMIKSDSKEFKEIPSVALHRYANRRLYNGYGNLFYIRLYIKNVGYPDLLSKLTISKLEELLQKATRKERERYIKLYNKYQKLEEDTKKVLLDIIL